MTYYKHVGRIGADFPCLAYALDANRSLVEAGHCNGVLVYNEDQAMVAMDEEMNEIVGMATYRIHDRAVEVPLIFVSPSHRRRNICFGLITQISVMIKKQFIPTITWGCHASNTEALKAYDKIGVREFVFYRYP